MIYSLFGSNRPPVFGLLLIPAIGYGILSAYWGEATAQPLGGPLFDLIYDYTQSSVLLIVLGLIVNLTGAFLINQIYNEHSYTERVTYFPALIYFLLVSIQSSWVYFNPVFVGNVFVLLALRRMLAMYRVQEITSMIYDAGLLLALGAMFFPLLVFVFPMLWVSLIQLRTFNFREWIVPLVGLLTPTAFMIGMYWWLEYELDISEFMSFSELSIQSLFVGHNFWYLPAIILSLFLLVAGIILFIREMNTSTVHRQNAKKVFISSNFLLLALCLYGLGLESSQSGIMGVLAIPVSVYTGVYFTRIRPKIFLRVLFHIWILLLLFYPVLAK